MTARIGHALGTVVLLVVFATVVAQSSGVITDDVYLQHLSTVAANAGEQSPAVRPALSPGQR